MKKESILKAITAAKRQFVNIAVSNRQGEWSPEYFSVIDIREFGSDKEKMIVVILHSCKDSSCVLMDSSHIHGLKFNKYLDLDGQLVEEIKLVSRDAALHKA